jgi:hypothetical protein
MPAALTLNDITFDGASCVQIVLGMKRVDCTSFMVPKEDVKVDKPRQLGLQRARKRTPGVMDLGTAAVEVLDTDYVGQILAFAGKHGLNLLAFPMLITLKHPTVNGSHNIALDLCRILGREGPELKGDEKALIRKLTIDPMNLWEKGGDGIWKCFAFEPGLPSSAAKALFRF